MSGLLSCLRGGALHHRLWSLARGAGQAGMRVCCILMCTPLFLYQTLIYSVASLILKTPPPASPIPHQPRGKKTIKI